MMSIRKLAYLLFTMCFCISAIGVANAATAGYNLAPGTQTVCDVPVSSGDTVQVTFTATGDESNALLFWIEFPNSTVANLGDVDQYSATLGSNVGGTYELGFNNTSTSETVLVALNYEVNHYIFGIPEMIFVLGAIAVFLVVCISVYALLSKQTYT